MSAALLEAADPSSAGTAATPPTRRSVVVGRAALTAVVGLVAATATAALRITVPVHGDLAIVGAAVLLLLLPTSPVLSRRILLSGALALGLTPTLWWVPLPLGSLGRAGLLLSLVVGGLAGWLASGGVAGLRRRARALLPRMDGVDAIPLLATAASTWVVSGWLRIRTGSAALAALLPGWDNSGHFDMVQMLLRHGLTIDLLGPGPRGETWQYADYPQGYHAVVATLVEAAGKPADPGAAALSYLHASAWVVALLGGLLAAAVCSVPALRRRPALALPAAALLVAAFVTGPGATAFTGGFPNFVFAAALTACIPLLVAATPRVPMPLHVAAIGALLVAVANSWILLLAVAVPAAVVLAFPLTKARWRGTRRRWVATSAVLLFVALGSLVPLRTLSSLSAGAVLVTPGGIGAVEPGFILAVALGAVVACLLGPSARPRGRAWHAVTPMAGLVAVGALGAWQLSSAGALSYYFYKLLVGVELVSLAVLVWAWPACVDRPRRRHGLGHSGRAAWRCRWPRRWRLHS